MRAGVGRGLLSDCVGLGWGGVGWGMGESLGCYGSICYTLPCPNFSLLKAPTRCYFTATEPEALELPPSPPFFFGNRARDSYSVQDLEELMEVDWNILVRNG